MLIDRLLAWPFPERVQTYDHKDTILYALGVGLGADPGDLPFVYEHGLQALPTMAAVLAHPGFWMADPRTGITWRRLLHKEQRLILFKPLPPAATVVGRTRVLDVTDRGAGRGAILVVGREVSEASSGALLCRLQSTYLLRDDGGFGGGATAPPPPPGPKVPERPADVVRDLPVSVRAPLIYRLSGDMNPLHVDPAVASAAGFARPILHGLCTFAIAGRGLLESCCDGVPSRLAALGCTFTAPVYPGETVRLEIWRNRDDVAFRASVPDRAAVVLDRGQATIRAVPGDAP